MDEFMHVAEIALPLLLQGLGTTAAISVLSILIAMVLGSAVGYMCLSKNKAVELIARAFIKIFSERNQEHRSYRRSRHGKNYPCRSDGF